MTFPPSCLPVPAGSLSELETDIRVFKDSMLKILDEDEIIEELCLTKWTDPRVLCVTLSLVHARAHAHAHAHTPIIKGICLNIICILR